MNDDELLRYSRHLLLPQIEVAGQEALRAARVLVLGLGGLGSPAALYLAAAGVGTLRLADYDTVELSNLQRQVIHDTDAVGMSKPASAARRIAALNPHVRCEPIESRFTPATLSGCIADCDLVVDCTDNARSRYAVNDACLAHRVPWVSAAAIRWEGQITAFDPRREDSPCYRCLHPDLPDVIDDCANAGVISPLVGILGCQQALEAIKMLAGVCDGVGRDLVGRVLNLDALTHEWLSLRLRRAPGCASCGNAD